MHQKHSTKVSLMHFLWIWPIIICILFLFPLVRTILLFALGGTAGTREETESWNYQQYFSPTQWAYPHLYLPGLIVFLLVACDDPRKHWTARIFDTVSRGCFFEFAWEMLETQPAQGMVAIGSVQLGYRWNITEPEAYAISKHPNITGIVKTLMNYKEEQPDTTSDLIQAFIGCLAIAIIMELFPVARTSISGLWGRRRWYNKLFYLCLVILAGYFTSLGIYVFYFKAPLRNYNIGLGIWIGLHHICLWILCIIDLKTVESSDNQNWLDRISPFTLFARDRKNALEFDQVMKNWIFHIFPWSMMFHFAIMDLKIPAYFTSWIFTVFFVVYCAVLAYGNLDFRRIWMVTRSAFKTYGIKNLDLIRLEVYFAIHTKQ